MADDARRPRAPLARRRDKAQLSCDPCRHRKLKCDRQQPCAACSRRGLPYDCTYPATPSSSAARQSISLHARISELEGLVVSLMQDPSLPPPSAVSEIPKIKRLPDDSPSPADPGTLNLHASGASYVQSVHWEAVLAKIRGLKDDLVADTKAPCGSHLFYGPTRHATRDDVLAAVPPRPVVDRLLALHFDSYFVTPYLIHSKKFLREYEAFWEDPSASSTAWLGLMFSMLFIAAQLQTFTVDSVDPPARSLQAEYLTMKDDFRERAVQCLVLAKYTKGGPYILETLITILTGEFVLLKDGATDGWLLIGTILHLAVRMGYHRDPDHFSGITPFQTELRRRVWTTILQLDLTLSLEMGLPRHATGTHIDTKEPSNLRDCDFDEDTTTMPQPRPETESTPVLPLIARARLISALGLICDINNDVNPPSDDEVIRADAVLEDVHTRAIPLVLRWGTTPHPITDPPNLVVQRVSVETTYHKAHILLYRRALINDSARPPRERDKEARRICLDSALEILSFQQMLHEESQPFGRLCQLRWKIVHIFNQDVLLATSLLCLYLQDVDTFELGGTRQQTTVPRRAEEIRQRLTISHQIWQHMSATSAEAGKVAKALSIVLGSTDTSTEDRSEPASYDFLTELDTMPPHDLGADFNHDPYYPSGFYSPLTYFDNVLESQGMSG